MWMISLFTSKILSVLFPSRCYNCNKGCISLCSSCLQHCKKSIDTPALYITSVYSFRDPLIKKVIHAIKYFHRKDLIAPLTQELTKEITKNLLTITAGIPTTPHTIHVTPWVLVPIPMPLLRKYMRGYNQAELIAQEISKQSSLHINTNLLIRHHSPKRQVTTKTRSERLENQHHSFKVIGNVKNMHIILVDDVTTTGATISEARNELLKAGASVVRAVALAH